MSSHHVVREAQEPALLILQAPALDNPHIAAILEWSPTIIVWEEALLAVLEQHIKIDAVLCYRNRQSEIQPLVQEQEPVAIIGMEEGENRLSAAIAFLKQHKHTAVNILTSTNTSENNLLRNQLSALKANLNLVLLDEVYKSSFYPSGKFIKWYPAGQFIWLHPAWQDAQLTTNGFVQDLEQTSFQANAEFETAGTGMVSITSPGPFWVIEKIN